MRTNIDRHTLSRGKDIVENGKALYYRSCSCQQCSIIQWYTYTIIEQKKRQSVSLAFSRVQFYSVTTVTILSPSSRSLSSILSAPCTAHSCWLVSGTAERDADESNSQIITIHTLYKYNISVMMDTVNNCSYLGSYYQLE